MGPAYFPLSMNKELQDLVFSTDRKALPQYNRDKVPLNALPQQKIMPKAPLGYGDRQPQAIQYQNKYDEGDNYEDYGGDDRYLDPSHNSNYLEELQYKQQRGVPQIQPKPLPFGKPAYPTKPSNALGKPLSTAPKSLAQPKVSSITSSQRPGIAASTGLKKPTIGNVKKF